MDRHYSATGISHEVVKDVTRQEAEKAAREWFSKGLEDEVEIRHGRALISVMYADGTVVL